MMEFKELGGDDTSEGEAEDLDNVKALTEKLKLQTRRPSYLEWKERVQSRPWEENANVSKSEVTDEHACLTEVTKDENSDPTVRNICGFDTIDDALSWLRSELVSVWQILCQFMLDENRLSHIATTWLIILNQVGVPSKTELQLK